jgi:hypothetical protein
MYENTQVVDWNQPESMPYSNWPKCRFVEMRRNNGKYGMLHNGKCGMLSCRMAFEVLGILGSLRYSAWHFFLYSIRPKRHRFADTQYFTISLSYHV